MQRALKRQKTCKVPQNQKIKLPKKKFVLVNIFFLLLQYYIKIFNNPFHRAASLTDHTDHHPCGLYKGTYSKGIQRN